MQVCDPIYEEGCAAGRAGATAAQNPYQQVTKEGGSCVQSQYDRWERGRARGARWCPHCDGTGQLPDRW